MRVRIGLMTYQAKTAGDCPTYLAGCISKQEGGVVEVRKLSPVLGRAEQSRPSLRGRLYGVQVDGRTGLTSAGTRGLAPQRHGVRPM